MKEPKIQNFSCCDNKHPMTCRARKINNKNTGLKMSITSKTAPNRKTQAGDCAVWPTNFRVRSVCSLCCIRDRLDLDSRSALGGFSKGLLGVDVCMKRPQWLQLMHTAGQHKPGVIVGTAVATQSCEPKHELDRKAAEKNSGNQILHTIQLMDAGRGISVHLLIAKAKGRLTDDEEETDEEEETIS
jgi:hypothetical protein